MQDVGRIVDQLQAVQHQRTVLPADDNEVYGVVASELPLLEHGLHLLHLLPADLLQLFLVPPVHDLLQHLLDYGVPNDLLVDSSFWDYQAVLVDAEGRSFEAVETALDHELIQELQYDCPVPLYHL